MILIVRDRETTQALETSVHEIRRGLFAHVRLYLLRRKADALLRRALKPYRAGSAAQLTPHLLRDIGLPPDFER